MEQITPLLVQHNKNQYVVSPRFELITDCLSKKTQILELLCTVSYEASDICSSNFFDNLDEKDTYLIYRHSLEHTTQKQINSFSLNVDVRFLKSGYIEMLFIEFSAEDLIFELIESSSKYSILEIQERLLQLNMNPRFQIWLDDFWTERSNFDLINTIKFDAIKISRDLFWDFYESDKAFLKLLFKILRAKTAFVVIEGVDSFDKYIFCKEQNCLMQGYFFHDAKELNVSLL